MPFDPGTRLGPYEIIAPFGAGGMGLPRTRHRLDRTIAIKVLTGALAADSESRRRFEHEARAIAALNDPHICTIHDVGRHGDLDYLVPFWSPDARTIGFFADDKLKRVDVAGGMPLVVADAPNARGGAWNADGVMLFAPGVSTPIMRVSMRRSHGARDAGEYRQRARSK